MKYSNLLILFLFSTSSQAISLQQKLDQVIDQTLPHAIVGVYIKDPQTGKVLYARNSDKMLSPASNVKILTAAAALYQLKPGYRYITSLYKNNQDIYLQFAGAPDLTHDNLKQLFSKLVSSGIKKINGNIVLDTSRFQSPDYAPGSCYDDTGWYYDAPITTLMLDGNAVAYEMNASHVGVPPKIKPNSTQNAVKLTSHVMTVSKDYEKAHCNLNVEVKPNNTLHLYGCVPHQEKPTALEFAIPNPLLYASQVIKSILKENQIVLQGRIITGQVPAQAQHLAAFSSKPLITLLTHMLEESDNLYAGSITKLLGFTLTKQGTFKQGAFAIKRILASHTHLDMHQLELYDGIGERYNYITPRQLVILLSDIYQDRHMNQLFMKTLPRMGQSGTLKDRMKNTALKNRILAKTGSLHDVSALSGYLVTPSGKTLIFSIISNNVHGDYKQAKTLEEKILLAVSGNSI